MRMLQNALAFTLGAAVVFGISSDAAAQASQRAQDTPPVTMSPPKLDFGHCLPGVASVGTVEMTNTGDRPLVVLRTQSSCKCTVPKIEETMILPGESISIESTVDVGHDFGLFAKRVSVFIDGYRRPAVFNVVGDVHYDVRTQPTSVRAMEEDETVRITVESVDGKPFNVLRAGGQPPKFVDYDPALDEPRTTYDVLVPLDEPCLWMTIETDHPKAPIVEFELSHPAARDSERSYLASPLKPDERRVNLGAMTPGEPVEFEVELKGPMLQSDATSVKVKLQDAKTLKLDSVQYRMGEDGAVIVVCKVIATEAGLIKAPLHFSFADLETRVWLLGSCRDDRS